MERLKKIKKSSFGLGVLLMFVLLVFSGCSRQSEEVAQVSNESGATVRFLYSDWPPDLIAYLAEKKGFFKNNGVNVELVQVSGYDELLEKKNNPDVSYVWSFTLLDALKEQATGEEEDGQIVLVEDYSAGADAVMASASSGIEKIADLKGRKVGVESGTVGEFFLNILLKREGLSLDDLEITSLASEEIPAALQSGDIEAGVAYQPDVSTALNEGAVLLRDTAQERGVIVDVYVGKRSHIQANKEAYQNFAKSIFEAADYYNAHPDESIDIMKDAFDIDPNELKETFDTLQIASLRDNQTAFNRSSGFTSLYNLGKQAEQFLEEQGVISKPLDYDALFGANVVDGISE